MTSIPNVSDVSKLTVGDGYGVVMHLVEKRRWTVHNINVNCRRITRLQSAINNTQLQ